MPTDPAISAATDALINLRGEYLTAWTRYCREIFAAAPEGEEEAEFIIKYLRIGTTMADDIKDHGEKMLARAAEECEDFAALMTAKASRDPMAEEEEE